MLKTNTGLIIDNHIQLDLANINMSEAYYMIITSPSREITLIIRYVMFNCEMESERKSYCSVWFLDKKLKNEFIGKFAIPLDEAIISNDRNQLSIGKNVINQDAMCGEISEHGNSLEWNFKIDQVNSIGIDRLPPFIAKSEKAGFKSPCCKSTASGYLIFNGIRYDFNDQTISCGHYYGKKKRIGWMWSNCVNFIEDSTCVFEAIAFNKSFLLPYLLFINIYWNGKFYCGKNLLSSIIHHRNLSVDLAHWSFKATDGPMTFLGKITADINDMIVHTHHINVNENLYTAVTYNADMELSIFKDKKLITQLHSIHGASFEVTKTSPIIAVKRSYV